jgi:hypothetical protein
VKKLLLIFLVVVVGLYSTTLQSKAQVQVDKEQWSKLSDGRDYVDNYKTPKPKEKKQEKTKNETSNNSSSDFRLGEARFIVYFLVVILIIVIIVRVLSRSQSNAKIDEKAVSFENITEIEERMHELSLDDLLAQALNAGNLRLALRLNFLIIIKLMTQGKIIKWKKDKTNWEYHREIKSRAVADQFREVIINFEGFWYGEHPLSETNYHYADKLYTGLREHLKANEKQH